MYMHVSDRKLRVRVKGRFEQVLIIGFQSLVAHPCLVVVGS